MKAFLFLYPIPEYIDFEIDRGSYSFTDPETDTYFMTRWVEGDPEEKNFLETEWLKMKKVKFRNFYATKLNECIDLRYRKKGFSINYAVFDGHEISDVIRLQPDDRIIEVGMDLWSFIRKNRNEKKYYPDPDFLLGQLSGVEILRIGGFHLNDCVEKVARRAYELGYDVLVDEDLTEFFRIRIKDENFQVDRYIHSNSLPIFDKKRKMKPWLVQR
ncbi:MAG: hypothetical protein DRP11_03180 [Candidatus Aenigmatarchaeota archaeon]|nr:MAG: hypothetical protein DRP11_03180 [Candidatus Aenigmarchaeota archaeon]